MTLTHSFASRSIRIRLFLSICVDVSKGKSFLCLSTIGKELTEFIAVFQCRCFFLPLSIVICRGDVEHEPDRLSRIVSVIRVRS